MPSFDIVKKSGIEPSFRNRSILDTYELKNDHVVETFDGNIDIENKKWNVGLITGRSGTGKTTIAKECFGDYYFENFKWSDKSVLENMPKEKTTFAITKIFNSVGFATVWSWLKPYHVLSNGEQMRVNLARCILEDEKNVVFDEFTSVVDRTVAKTSSSAISKAVRKMNRKFIAVSCHKDIIDWLEPDWVYDTDSHKFFFAQENTNAPKLHSQFKNQTSNHGKYLESIII